MGLQNKQYEHIISEKSFSVHASGVPSLFMSASATMLYLWVALLLLASTMGSKHQPNFKAISVKLFETLLFQNKCTNIQVLVLSPSLFR